MPTISGSVFYTPTNELVPAIGIPNVPVVLRDPAALNGAVALTDVNGTFVFTSVPNGTYQIIEAFGTPGGIPTPVSYPAALLPMPTAPTEAEPPLSAIPVAPPPLADMLMAISPNLLNITVTDDVTSQNFYDAPVGSKPIVFNGLQMAGPNLITAADNGSFGTVPAGSPVNTIPAVAPYPAATPGLPYQAAPEITDGHYSIVNTRRKVDPLYAWWNLSDHETMLETGRFMFVNGDTPGAVLFTNTVNVTPNTFYTFTGWGLNLLNFNGTPPRFSIRVIGSDGSELGYDLLNSINFTPIPVWYQGGFLFSSGAFSSITVEVISEAPASLEGNDYVIDELRLFETTIIDLLQLEKTMSPGTIYSNTSGAGRDVTVTVTVTNTSAINAPEVVFQDTIDPRLLFVPGSVTVNGSGTGLEAADPNAGFSLGDMAPGAINTVVFHVTTVAAGPAMIPNTANVTYDAATNGNGDIIRNTVDSNTATLDIIINRANVAVEKIADKTFAKTGDVLTYTLNLQNTGNVSANHVVLTDSVPAGTTFVPGSLTGATGTPPTLRLPAPIAAGGNATVTFQVRVGPVIPDPNPIPNTAAAAYTYTVDPAQPNGVSAVSHSNLTETQINIARLVATKSSDKFIAYIGDIITYQVAVQNTGNVPADNAVLTDLLPAGVSYVAGSLTASVPYSGSPATGLTLTDAIAPGQMITLSFQVKVDSMPNPNPIVNKVTAAYAYTVDPEDPDANTATATSNEAQTVVFRYRFGQQINDLIDSVAFEQAALAAIAQAEGAKIQKIAAMGGATTQELLCLNKSVADMMDSIAMLEAVLRQKLYIVSCQISGGCM